MAKAFPLLTINPVGTMADNVSLMLHTRLAEMLHFARHIEDPLRVAELHNMRIAAKRLRYTMELFLPYVDGANGKALAGLLDRTKKVQEMIGDIHDRDVRIPLILGYVRRHEAKRPEIRSGLLALAEREQAERNRIYTDLIAYWQEQQGKYIGRLTSLIAALAQEAFPGAAPVSPVLIPEEPPAPKIQSVRKRTVKAANADSGA